MASDWTVLLIIVVALFGFKITDRLKEITVHLDSITKVLHSIHSQQRNEQAMRANERRYGRE